MTPTNFLGELLGVRSTTVSSVAPDALTETTSDGTPEPSRITAVACSCCAPPPGTDAASSAVTTSTESPTAAPTAQALPQAPVHTVRATDPAGVDPGTPRLGESPVSRAITAATNLFYRGEGTHRSSSIVATPVPWTGLLRERPPTIGVLETPATKALGDQAGNKKGSHTTADDGRATLTIATATTVNANAATSTTNTTLAPNGWSGTDRARAATAAAAPAREIPLLTIDLDDAGVELRFRGGEIAVSLAGQPAGSLGTGWARRDERTLDGATRGAEVASPKPAARRRPRWLAARSQGARGARGPTVARTLLAHDAGLT